MFLELLLVLAIIMFITFKVFNLYFKKPALNEETQKVITEQGIDTTSLESIADSTKKVTGYSRPTYGDASQYNS